ncbi:hypothetical protein KP509_17G061100 [Ceratopteris richardii]|uniref:Reverse transcriptase zinc-binding domain-containing protein n=1 Tax=Ceratopteris richardii TaxID=49495 RepID=A0A8T2SYQ6_CERRI|nr:hypothetical protein KP509_17G061100 [Ceratopteris richardii]
MDSASTFSTTISGGLSIDAFDPWRDWLFAKHTSWWAGNASTYYLSLLEGIAGQCDTRWKLKKLPSWWHTRFRALWDFPRSFKMRVFMWRISTCHFTLGAFLSKHGIIVKKIVRFLFFKNRKNLNRDLNL